MRGLRIIQGRLRKSLVLNCPLDRGVYDLAKSQSGTFRSQEKISTRGNARLRLALYIASTVAIRQRENSFRDKFDRYTKLTSTDADCKRKAMTAVMAKMARVIHGLIKSNQPYQSYFEVSPSGSTFK